MTATNIFYNFVGFRYSPPLNLTLKESDVCVVVATVITFACPSSDPVLVYVWCVYKLVVIYLWVWRAVQVIYIYLYIEYKSNKLYSPLFSKVVKPTKSTGD